MSRPQLVCNTNQYKLSALLVGLSTVKHTSCLFQTVRARAYVCLSVCLSVCACVCLCVWGRGGDQIFTFRHITSSLVCNLQFTKIILVEISILLCGSLKNALKTYRENT
jgi:hypothetical protein